MQAKALLCVPLGHKWHTARTDTPYPVLECERCGRLRELTAESGDPEGLFERAGRSARMGGLQDAGIQRKR
jgi:hypothetical protein